MCKENGSCGGRCIPALIGKILLIVGGLNWGLVGVGVLMGKTLNDWNVVNMLLGTMPKIEAIVYVLVGVAAIVSICGCKCSKCKVCCGSCDASSTDANKM